MEYLLGIRPSCEKGIHLGHLLGVLHQCKDLQHVAILIADLYEQKQYSPLFSSQIRKILPKADIIRQSASAADIFNIQNRLSQVVPVSHLERMTQYKSKKENGNTVTSLLTYPLMMTADLMIFCKRGRLVIVGKDQFQHIEYANDFIQKFNKAYETDYNKIKVKEGRPITIMDLKDPLKKMSKSNADIGTLYLTDEPNVIKSKITKATTTEEGLKNLTTIYKLLTGSKPIFELNSELKTKLIDIILEYKSTKKI